MPLIKSASKAAVGKNISEMVKAGYPQKQAVAASLSNQRRVRAKGVKKVAVKKPSIRGNRRRTRA